MPRPPVREPQNDKQRIEYLERMIRQAQIERDAVRHEVHVLRTLMTRFLTAEQIMELVAEMDALRRQQS